MSTINWTHLDRTAVKAGDIVSADAGGMPIYRVVSVDGGLATLQDPQRLTTHSLPLTRLHWTAAAGAR